MAKIDKYRIQVLREAFNNNTNYTLDLSSLKEWLELEAENDPKFYSWLFNDETIKDFGSNLTPEQQEHWQNFLAEL
jgi:hypothetical protein